MSLVGTRPPTVDEWDKYELHHRARLATKPGLTGMWQVSGRSNITDFEEVVKLDKQYISEWTILMYEIILYDTEDGRCPVQELLDSLETKLLAKTLRTIDLLEMNGPLLCEPYSKPLENGIFELRTKQGSDITRVLYFFIVGKKAVLTNGFIKKSQKTPKAEKELAKKYKADYERRYGNE